MTGFDIIKFWTLRHFFWISTLALLVGILSDLSSHGFHFTGISAPVATLLGFYLASLTLLHNQVRAAVTEYNRLDEKFTDQEMRELRALVASNYAEKGSDDWEDLFDFLEDIALKTRLGIIEMQIAYQMFSYWILNYWFLCEDRLEERRKATEEDKDLYSELEWLVGRFAVLNFNARGEWFLDADSAIKRYRPYAKRSQARFLEEELDMAKA